MAGARRVLAAALVALLLSLAWGVAAASRSAQAPATGSPTHPLPVSSEHLIGQAPFNRPEHYPLDRRPDPALYRPHGLWMGRLILPTLGERERLRPAPERAGTADWVWLELQQAPADRQELVGRRLRLTWRTDPELEALVRAVTTDIHLGSEAEQAARSGNVLPHRLDGRRAVGPLESLAGARERDDVTVRLEQVQVEPEGEAGPVLRIGRPPVQTTGRWTALVRIEAAAGGQGSADRFQVRHFNPATRRFDGHSDTLRIPAQPLDRFGRPLFQPTGLATSPAGAEGWYVHGAPDAAGLFTVQALEPRALLRPIPDRSIQGTGAGLHHIAHENWSESPSRRGRFRRVSLQPGGWRTIAGITDGKRKDPWSAGDRALLIHSFGGIGGVQGEPTPAFTVTGHFAFGQAEVVSDPFSGEPRFALTYHQIYASNPNGIVAGSQDWSAYSGNLQRGWLGTRPISDVLVPGDGDLLEELALQAEVLMARYRSGDGAGVTSVTPAISCVQDSSQALFATLTELRRRTHGSPGSGREKRLAALDATLEQHLAPFGLVRPDWRSNALRVASLEGGEGGVGPVQGDGFARGEGLVDGLLSWRSMLPRRAHDDLASVFLRHDNPLWILRTDQVPGANPRLEPLAPTLLLGQLPPVSTAVRRFADALFTPLSPRSFALGLALLGLYAAVAIPMGLRSGLLEAHPSAPSGRGLAGRAAALLLMPALVEEGVFRVLLLPHPLEGGTAVQILGWGALSVGLFVAYHPLARFWYHPARHLFATPRFLVPCTLLGVTAVIAYEATGSLWPPVLLHWLVVLVWLEAFGGRASLRDRHS